MKKGKLEVGSTDWMIRSRERGSGTGGGTEWWGVDSWDGGGGLGSGLSIEPPRISHTHLQIQEAVIIEYRPKKTYS